MAGVDIIHEINMVRIKNHQRIPARDRVVDETILGIHIDGEPVFQMVFSMTHTPALVAGFLFTQGIVREKADILDLHFSEKTLQCRVTLTPNALKRLDIFKKNGSVKGSSGGIMIRDTKNDGRLRTDDDFCITDRQVLSLIQAHWDHSKLFQETGALHSAGLCNPYQVLAYFEDIGRHNALDKLAGHVLLNGIDTRDKVATLSCRMSLEIIGKIIRTGIPIVISNAAPTLSAISLADRNGLTLIGFARDNRFNIYTHEKRIKMEKPGP